MARDLEDSRLDHPRFAALLKQLAEAWTELDTRRALTCFTEDAVYMEPPDRQLFRGYEQLRPYFAALKPGTLLHLHHVWFDESRQVGAAEYSFGRQDQGSAVHGVTVVELRGGRIARWREYQRRGALAFDDFLETEGKEWRWHIGNYP